MLRDNIRELIGFHPLERMYENHQHHAEFMVNLFFVNDYQLPVDTVPWVYRTYRQHGFEYDYFPLSLSDKLLSLIKRWKF